MLILLVELVLLAGKLVFSKGSGEVCSIQLYGNANGLPRVAQYPPANAGDAGDGGSVSGMGRSPGEGNGNPLQYSCLENPMDRGAWWAIVPGVAKSRT